MSDVELPIHLNLARLKPEAQAAPVKSDVDILPQYTARQKRAPRVLVHVHAGGPVVTSRRIGHWGTGAAGDLPDPDTDTEADWDGREREDVEDYLSRGFISRAHPRVVRCRICGRA